MEEDIKILEEFINYKNINNTPYHLIAISHERLCEAIENLIERYKELDKDNNDLRLLYKRTAKKLMENGKKELADYFLAQINAVPTFVVDDDIDYYGEYHKLLKVIDKMAEKIYKLKVKLETNDLLQDCFIPREFSDINDCIKKDCKECLKEYFMKEDN